ncbi:MAG: hypothetical protein Q9208_002131 [Pyrenodesmia sp. 3 TL-2023]
MEASIPGPSGVKLRDSCESCASSKVKCSRDKPTCRRCAERGTKCLYSIQQRTGRKFRRRDSISSNASFFPDLEQAAGAAGLSGFDSSFGALDENTILSTTSDGFMPSHTPTDSLSLPVMAHPDLRPEHSRSFAAGNSTYADPNALFQSYERFLSASGEMGLEGEDFGLASLTSSFPIVDGDLGVAGSQQPPDTLETALRLMQQLSCGEDQPSPTSPTKTSHNHQETQPPQLQMVMDRNRLAIEAVHSTLQTTRSQDGYFLVVVCLVVSKVLTTYASAVRVSKASETERRRSSVSASSTLGKSKDAMAAQRVLDALYQVQASMDQLGVKMQLWAKRNATSGSDTFPIGNDTSHTTPVGFPFSATVLNHLYTEVRKRLSTLSLGLIDELKQYWA